MDQLFLEAEGNRRIANQIAQRAFLARQDVLPTGQKVASSFAYCLGRLNCTRDMFWHLFFSCFVTFLIYIITGVA